MAVLTCEVLAGTDSGAGRVEYVLLPGSGWPVWGLASQLMAALDIRWWNLGSQGAQEAGPGASWKCMTTNSR